MENLDFHVAVYFMTIETLGRPNIPCSSALGYILLYSVVVVGYIFLPKQLADLSSTWAGWLIASSILWLLLHATFLSLLPVDIYIVLSG